MCFINNTVFFSLYYFGRGENDLDKSCLSSSNNSEAKIHDVEESDSAMLSASLSDCFRATPTDTFTFFAEISSVGGAIRPAENEVKFCLFY